MSRCLPLVQNTQQINSVVIGLHLNISIGSCKCLIVVLGHLDWIWGCAYVCAINWEMLLLVGGDSLLPVTLGYDTDQKIFYKYMRTIQAS